MEKGNIVCLYTCPDDSDCLTALYNSEVLAYLGEEEKAYSVFEVYADPTIKTGFSSGRRVFVPAAESYDSLSTKTYAMIDYFTRGYKFNNLIKIDSTVALPLLGRSANSKQLPVSPSEVVGYLKSSGSWGAYGGLRLMLGAGQAGAEAWAARKGGVIDYKRIFGDASMPPYFTGKCYSLSRRFCEYITGYGGQVAIEQKKYLFGSEDVMIGRLYQDYLNEHGENDP